MDGMKTHAILIFSAALALGGCATDDARLREIDDALREAVRDAWTRAAAQGESPESPKVAVESQVVELPEAPLSNPNTNPGAESGAEGGPNDSPASVRPAGSAAEGEPLDFGALRWPWGGFDGSKAALADKARVKSLKVSRSGLSYSWASGGCEDLGASSRTDASCLACLFCFDGSSWRGGKFDWISTSRTSRDLENIESGYNGWDAAAFRSAKAHAFCIVSKDGRKRTNVIVQEGGLK